MTDLVDGYNHQHRHTGIGLHTPAEIHDGLATATAAARSEVLTAARAAHPERFATSTDPQIPATACLNQPPDNTEHELAA